MNKKILITLIIIVIVLIALLVWGGLWLSKENPPLEAFAKCLASKNITMYGTPWCEWCQKQEALFGKSFRLIPYIDCSKNPQECITKGINVTPTWIFPDGKKLTGYQGVEKLAEASNCPL